MPSVGWLVLWLVKGSVLLALLFPVAALLRRASSSARHLVWTAGLAIALLLPLVSSGLLPLRVEVPARVASLLDGTAAVSAPEGAGPSPAAALQAPDWAMPEQDAASEAAATTEWTRQDVARGLLLLWLAGAAILMLRLVASTVRLRRLVRQATPLAHSSWTTPLFEAADRLELPDVPRLLMSESAAMPFTCGVREPLIVVPVNAAEWSDERRRAVLSHELAHIRRRDVLSHLVGRVTCALYWFQPLAWSAARRMRAESERACDDLVLTMGTRASAYADHLLQIVTAARQDRAPIVALPMAQAREFESRLLSILAPALRREPPSRGQGFGLVAAVLVVALPLVALSPVPPQVDGVVAADGSDHEQSGPPPHLDSTMPADPALSANPAQGADPRPDPQPLPSRGSVDVDLPALGANVQLDLATIASAAATGIDPKLGKYVEQAFQEQDPRVVAALLEALRGPDAEVRRVAAWALSNHNDTAAIRGLTRALGSDDDARVREMSAWALAEVGARGAAPRETLIRAMQADTDSTVRFMSLWALAQLGSRDAAPAIERVLASDPSDRQRAVAAWALGELGQRSSVAALNAALDSRSVDVRERAAWAIGEIGEGSAAPQLIAMLGSTEAQLRTIAAWALGQLEDPAAASGLARLLDDPDPNVRRAALWALGSMPAHDAVIDALTRALRSDDAATRRAAAAALGGRGGSPWPWPRPWPIVRISP